MAEGMRLYGYVCPVCKTWAEDMTPHCFMVHEVDPIETLAIYVAERDGSYLTPPDRGQSDGAPEHMPGGPCVVCGHANNTMHDAHIHEEARRAAQSDSAPSVVRHFDVPLPYWRERTGE